MWSFTGLRARLTLKTTLVRNVALRQWHCSERVYGTLGSAMELSRADKLRATAPQLIADVTFYSAAEGGRDAAVLPGWGCPCLCSKSSTVGGWDGWPILYEPLAPGDRRRLGFVFLSGEEATSALRKAGRFYLWEAGFIGEAVVVA